MRTVTVVLIVDDEELIRGGLRAIIDAEPDLTVVGEAADGAEVLPLVRRLRPDVVLMDVRMPGVDGIQATRQLLATVAEPPKILVVTTFENDDYVYEALRAGASGFLLKRARPVEIMRAIRRSPRATRCCSPPRSVAWRRDTDRRELRWPPSPSARRRRCAWWRPACRTPRSPRSYRRHRDGEDAHGQHPEPSSGHGTAPRP